MITGDYMMRIKGRLHDQKSDMKIWIFPGLMFLFLVFQGKSVNAQYKQSMDQIFGLKLEEHLISKGDNFPDFRTRKDSLDKFLFALHRGYTPDEFRTFTKFSKDKMVKLITFLESKNWLHQVDNQYKPTVFIADAKDGELLYSYAKPISEKITRSIAANLPGIKTQFEKTEISGTQDFQKWSFLILSNVLLDSWQIDQVERDFLKQGDRPLRNGKHYYYQIAEHTSQKIESFGIYGNQSQEIGGQNISVYGNNRLGLEITSSGNRVSKADNKILEEIAGNYLPHLLKILENERNYSRKVYSKLGYDKEISFEEFFIWWYHFIYTQATNEMNEKGMLTIPAGGNFDYHTEE